MKYLILIMALITTPVYAQQSQLKPHQLELQRMMAENQKKIDSFKYPNDEQIKKSVEAYLKAADEHAKALAACKTCVKTPTYQVPILRFRSDNLYVPMCAYGSC
jgi:hypothetical protein